MHEKHNKAIATSKQSYKYWLFGFAGFSLIIPLLVVYYIAIIFMVVFLTALQLEEGRGRTREPIHLHCKFI